MKIHGQEVTDKTIIRIYETFRKKVDQLNEKMSTLEKSLKEKYPECDYGIKWMMIYEERSAKYQEQLRYYRRYLQAFEDVIYMIEANEFNYLQKLKDENEYLREKIKALEAKQCD